MVRLWAFALCGQPALQTPMAWLDGKRRTWSATESTNFSPHAQPRIDITNPMPIPFQQQDGEFCAFRWMPACSQCKGDPILVRCHPYSTDARFNLTDRTVLLDPLGSISDDQNSSRRSVNAAF
ncbi:hypothetical protein BCR34DRAFT_573228 [Clohesyomyces aquaticus]|uniref:Uncharacterized protein n=1 Tax=Clohesyomyces aquaticus TaxID=1231657 RepID=A0A1Y1Z0N8_9PLEO|nr:hypothetical protein BCR34DRAFT_573228 [Clohesyomyces aquaticus]